MNTLLCFMIFFYPQTTCAFGVAAFADGGRGAVVMRMRRLVWGWPMASLLVRPCAPGIGR